MICESTTLGGMEIQALNILRALDTKRVEAHVIIGDLEWSLTAEFKKHAKKYTCLESIDLDKKRSLTDIVIPSKEKLDTITKYIKDNDIDVVHLFNGLQYVFAVPQDVPLIITLGGDFRRGVYYSRVNVMDEIDIPLNPEKGYMTIVNRYQRKKVRKYLEGHKSVLLLTDFPKSAKVFRGTPSNHIRSSIYIPKNIRKRKQPTTVIWVGRNSPEKRPDYLFKIAELLPEYKFIMVVSTFRHPLAYAQIPGNVEVYENMVDTREMFKMYKQADIFLLTSETEGFPLTIGEGISQQCFPIVSKVGDIRGPTLPVGILVDPDCGPQAYVKAIKRWTKTDPKQKAEQRKKMKKVAAIYDIANNIGRYHDYYNTATYTVKGGKDFTVAMLMSRNDLNCENAIKSVVNQNPDEFIVGLDPKLKKDKKLLKRLDDAGARIVMQKGSGWKHSIECWHRILFDEVRTTWVVHCDDDDQLLGDFRNIIKTHGMSDVGVIFGNVEYSNGFTKVPRNVFSILDIVHTQGSGTIFNHNALLEMRKHVDDKPWQDYKFIYWIIKYGYDIVNSKTVQCYVNQHTHDIPSERLNAGRWDNVLANLEMESKRCGIISQDSHDRFFREVVFTLEDELTTVANRILGKPKYSGNILYRTGKKNDTLVLCHWHPDRAFLLKRWLRAMQKNKVDILFHVNSFKDRRITQLLGEQELEQIGLEHDYKYYWVTHSDVIPPPFALKKLKAAKKDIISAVVPRPIVNGLRSDTSYLCYTTQMHTRDGAGSYEDTFVFSLRAKDITTRSNPLQKILPYNEGVVRVEGMGVGCCLLTRKALKETGMHRYDLESVKHIDTQWSRLVRLKTDYKFFVHTDVRCKHLCPPVNAGFEQNTFGVDWIEDEDDWYGWEED
jgi:glycosyltransferase involved in cell wall biosynthesis